MSRLELRRIDKSYGAVQALAGVDVAAEAGEILGVTGPSGAGKSTLCRIVSGLDLPARGEVLIDGVPQAATPTERRRVAFMFESYALYPRLSVFDNVAFPLRAPGAPRLSRAVLADRVREVLRLVEMDALAERRPGELSGGQRQRVALCRALVQEPRAYLLDEPLSHLDAKLRHTLRGAVRRRLVRAAAPTIWTSPDALEALAVADRVAVLVGGRVEQIGAPAEVYRRPATIEVARLVGDPPMNLLAGSLAEVDGQLYFRHAAFEVPLPAAARARAESAAMRDGAVLGLRPSDVAVASAGAALNGTVWIWEPLGKSGVLSVRLGADVVKITVPRAARFEPGEPVALALSGEPALFDGATGAAL
jgi:ABC-type sugar transport system ATPase subunit